MPYVETSTVIKGDVDEIYRLAKDMESYPRFMADVVSVRVVERDGNSTVTEWVTRPRGVTLKWKERDLFDDEKRHIRYYQLEGDVKKFEGDWFFEPTPEGVKVTLTVDFEIGIPMFATLLNPFAGIIVRQNCESMLKAIKEQVEKEQAQKTD